MGDLVLRVAMKHPSFMCLPKSVGDGSISLVEVALFQIKIWYKVKLSYIGRKH